MKVITLYQPWASAVALGFKRIETRSWRTNHRGLIGIHAGMTTAAVGAPAWDAAADLVVAGRGSFYPLGFPNGELIATCTLVDCVPILDVHAAFRESDHGRPCVGADEFLTLYDDTGAGRAVTDEEPWGDFTPGRYAWLLEDARLVDPPVPMRGRQGLWTAA